MTKFIFWLSLTIIFYTYLAYPIIISILAKFKRKKDNFIISEYPTVSIIMPLFNEAEVIEQKIKNLLKLDYPRQKIEILIGSDGSYDNTELILKKNIHKGIKFFSQRKRQGKPYTINKLASYARGEILFFTDARQEIESSALKRLVRNFADAQIGCVSGELIYRKKEGIASRGVGLYWEYEKFLRQKESQIYAMIGATGAIYACRKELFEPLPDDIILDDLYTPFMAVKKGYRAIFDREAKAYDEIAETPREEHRRKKRTLAGNYQIFFRMPEMLNPFKSKIALQIISHKLLRVLMPFFMIAFFVSNLMLAGSPFYYHLFILQSLFYLLALTEAILRRRLNRIKKLFFGVPYMFCLLNFSALVGLWEFVFGKQDVRWEKARAHST
jgi:cellulose synthase/poly-beta-1,6-N-acetylglucosamine synthase-like glycosyltransferase